MLNYKYLLGFTASIMFAAIVAAADSDAQTADASSSSNSGSSSQSSSQSGSNSTNAGNRQAITFNQNGAPVPSAYSYSTQQSGFTSSDVTLRTTPTVYAPPVSGGNPCTLAVSGGVSVVGWGASAGGTFVDQDCANRQKIAMIWNAGFKGPAKELMCNDRATYDAFKTAGEPCALRSQYEPVQVQARPTVNPVNVQAYPTYPMTPPVVTYTPPKDYPRCNAKLGIVDNCQS